MKQTPEEVDFRAQLVKEYEGRAVSFKPTVRVQNGRKRRIFNDGPQLTFDSGYTSLNLFKLLFKMKRIAPTRAQLTKFLAQYGIPDEPGLYLLEATERRMVITTKSLAKSYAKVIFEMLNTDKGMDLFTKRVVKAKLLSFKVLYTGPANYRLGANYSGMYDTMNPSVALTDTGYDYRRFAAAYRKGLVAGGNFVTLTIENELANGSRPVFIGLREAIQWNPSFSEIEVVSDEMFSSRLFNTINSCNKVEFD